MGVPQVWEFILLLMTSLSGAGEEVQSTQQGTIGQGADSFQGTDAGTLFEKRPGLDCACLVIAGQPDRMGETLSLESGEPSFNIPSGTWGWGL